MSPVVQEFYASRPDPRATADEYHCRWYRMTDRVAYLPGIKGKLSYSKCFHDLPRGLQTHVYGSSGLDIKKKYTIGGNEPNEEREILEIGLAGAPRDGLYLREDVDIRCSVLTLSIIRKNMQRQHKTLVERLLMRADLEERKLQNRRSAREPRPVSSRSGAEVPKIGGSAIPASPRIDAGRPVQNGAVRNWSRPGSQRTPSVERSVTSPRDSSQSQQGSLTWASTKFEPPKSTVFIAELPGDEMFVEDLPKADKDKTAGGAPTSTGSPKGVKRRDSSIVAEKMPGMPGMLVAAAYELE